MVPRNFFSHLMLLLSVFLPSASSLSFSFHSFNKSTPTLMNLEGDAFWNHAIQLTKNEIDASGPSTGAAVYPQPLLLWDPATRNLTDFTTHFSFKTVAANNSCLCSGLAFFLSPYPSDAHLGLFSKASTLDASSENPTVAVEVGASRNKGDPSNCHVGIDIGSIEPDPYINCNDDITKGRASSATISYSSGDRTLAVLVTYSVNEDEPGSVGTLGLSHQVDLRDVLPNEVTMGFSAAAADSSTEFHEIRSWNFSSTLVPSPASAPSPAPPMSGYRAYAAGGNVRLLMGLVGGSLGAAMVVVGTVGSILWYKMAKLAKHVKGDSSIKPQVLANPSLGDISLFLDDNPTSVEAVAGVAEQPAAPLGHPVPAARHDTRGANRRTERLLHRRIFNWIYSKLFKSDHLGCI